MIHVLMAKIIYIYTHKTHNTHTLYIYRSYRWQTKVPYRYLSFSLVKKQTNRRNDEKNKNCKTKKVKREMKCKLISYKWGHDILNEKVLWVKFRYILLLKVLKKHTKNHPHIILYIYKYSFTSHFVLFLVVQFLPFLTFSPNCKE